MPMRRSIMLVLLLLPFLCLSLRADEKSSAGTLQQIGLGDRAGEIAVSNHAITVNGRVLNYTSTSGYLNAVTEKGEHKAAIFYVAYTLDGTTGPADRPVTFAFNGGPGSSSVWLHLGALGPRRVDMQDMLQASAPPYKLVDNAETWLDLTDLVFIDPVGTGYSRPAPEEKREQFHGVDEDVKSVGDFVRLWTSQNERWASPKFLAGESYGTTRAAGLSGYLQDRHGMYLNGLMLVSSILQFNTARFDPGNLWPYVLFLPTYTATSWYHNKLSAELQADLRTTLDEVEEFAMNDYLPALAQGTGLAESERQRIADKLVEYTGLDRTWILLSDLKINIHQFCKELLRTNGVTVGRLDSRFTGIDRDGVGEWTEHDPSLTAIMGPYTALLNDYVRRELKYENDLPYEILTGRVRPWNWGNAASGYTNVAETLREAMTKNPELNVWIANGYFDLATPYFATEFTLHQMGLEQSRRDNITMTYYPAGHMMYVHTESLKRFKEDFSNFILSALSKSR